MFLRIFQKFVWRKLPPEYRRVLYNILAGKRQNQFQKRIAIEMSDAIVVSYPKCGRTWLRFSLGLALKDHFGMEMTERVEIHKLNDANSKIPRIYFTHDDNPHNKRAETIEVDKSDYRDKRIVFLVRDPRDVLVSLFYHKSFRSKKFSGSLDDYLKTPVGGLDSIVQFYNVWARSGHTPLLIISYEDMHADPQGTLGRVLEFCGVVGVAPEVLERAALASRFENMRNIETEGTLSSDKLRGNLSQGSQGLKVRSGKVGSYSKELSLEQQRKVDLAIERQLDETFRQYKYGSLE